MLMKWLCVLLLLLNACYFGWQLNERIYAGAPPASSQPAAVAGGVTKLLLLSELERMPESRNETPPAQSSEPSPAPAPQNTPGPVAQAEVPPPPIDVPATSPPAPANVAGPPPVPVTAPAQPAAAPAGAVEIETRDTTGERVSTDLGEQCFSIGPLPSQSAVAALRQRLSAYSLRTHERTQEKQERKFFWVYLEPVESAARAEQQLQDLKKKGVADFFLIRKGEMKNAVSLGVFRSQESVTNRLAELQDRGYKPVVVPRYEAQSTLWLDVAIDTRSGREEDVRTRLPAGAELSSIGCDQIAAAAGNQ